MANWEKHVVRMAALGRHFQLGGIYDYLNDRFLKDSHFDWKSIDSQELIPEVNSEFQIKTTTQNSTSKKWENMELDQHSQASILADLIDKYRGASNYLNEHENPKQLTYTVICRIESSTEKMNLSNIADLEIEEGVKPDVNPHVIVGIVYGAEIYCVLTQDLRDETDEDAKQDAENNLQEWAEKMENALDCKHDLIDFKDQFGQDEKQQLNRMKCRVYADVHAKSFRECGFFDAYKLFLEVIEQTKSKRGTKSKAVPIVYELCPLKIIANSDAAARNQIEIHEVDADLLTQCYDIWSQLENIVARAKALVKFSKKSSSLSKFVEYIKRYQELVNKRVKVSILNARKSTDDDNDTADKEFEKIINIIENHSSCFKPSRLERFLDIKMAEIEIIQKINSSTITFVATHDQLKKKLDEDLETKYALVLHIPSLDEVSNQILETMKRIENLQKLANFNDYNEEDEDDDDQEPWHMNQAKKQQVINKIREFSYHVANNQELENPVQFYITAKDRKKGPICQYFVYADGEILKENVQLPDPPTDLQVHSKTNSENTRNVKIRLEWNYKDIGYPHHFLIQYRQSGSLDSWTRQQQTKEGQKQVTINLKRASMLEFRVAAETCIGRSNFSETFDMDESASFDYGDDTDDRESTFSSVSQSTVIPRSKTNAKCKEAFDNFNDSDEEEELSSVLEATHIQKEPKRKKQNVECKPPSFTDLSSKPRTYSQNSEPSNESANQRSSDVVPTTPLIDKQTRFISTILERCRKIGSRNGLDLLAVPLKQSSATSLQNEVRRFVLDVPAGKKNNQHKTILIMGATGAGKTTLINAMINYIFGVEWEDNFRFQLIEEQLAGQSQAHSQTSIITAYDIHHMDGFQIPYSLTIVDTPGYGDTKGLERDEEITEMIRKFFEDKNGIQELDVVGFVAQASLPRLTPTQIYIFDSVLSIFGNDVKENINFLLTFADSQKPPVLSAIRAANLPCPTNADGELLHHKFNNSGFFCSNQSFGGGGSASTVDKFNRFFWKMGMDNFQKFFAVLTTMKTQSLSLTKQVLDERKKLETTVDGLQPLIKIGLSKMEELRKINQVISNSQAQIDANQDVKFEVEVTVPKKVDIPAGQYLTNCNKCYVTCHNPCAYQNDDDKVNCTAMDLSKPETNRPCRICPEKCVWNMHANQPYCWEYVKEKQVTSSDAIKEKYEAEMNRKLSAKELIKLLERDIKENEKEVLAKVDIVASCIKRLDEIALRPNPFSTPQYIDLIIDAEEQEKKPGFKERIKSLLKLRGMASTIKKVINKESLYGH